jgi:ComF family protein
MKVSGFLEQLANVLLPLHADVRIARATSDDDLHTRARIRMVDCGVEVCTVFSFKDPLVRALIHALKYHGERRVARLFATALTEHAPTSLPQTSCIVVPIPLSSTHKHTRRYNQSALIAAEWIKNVPHAVLLNEALVRVRNTESQARQRSRAARIRNAHGNFEVPKRELISGRDIVVIDDVTTTGSTLREAHRALKAAGARRVYLIAMAH